MKWLGFNRRWMFWICVASLMCGGCKKKKSIAEKIAAYEAKEAALKKKAYELQEVYGDPKIYSTPRLQFTMRRDGDDVATIWSIRLDGTDLRQAYPAEIFVKHKWNMIFPPARSPDNRYIAIGVSGVPYTDTILLDIKTHTHKTLFNGGNPPDYQWTSDSQNLYFFQEARLRRYHVPTGKLQVVEPGIYSLGFYILQDSNKFLAIRSFGFEIYSPERKLLKKVMLVDEDSPLSVEQYHAASINGERLMYQTDRLYIIDPKDPKHPLYQGPPHPNDPLDGYKDCLHEGLFHAAFGPQAKQLYFYCDGVITKLDIASKKMKTVFKSDEHGIGRFISLINFRKKP